MMYKEITSTEPNTLTDCSCCAQVTVKSEMRRRLLKLWTATVGGTIMAGWVTPVHASTSYDAMLVNCIDPRFTTEHYNALATLKGVSRAKMGDNYSHFVIAGGALGAVHPAFAKWHDTFWENLDVSVKLHKIKRVVGLTHRDCGAAKIALGASIMESRDSETKAHTEWLKTLSKSVKARHPQLEVICGVIDFDGKIDQVKA
jgi:hypothetical protein